MFAFWITILMPSEDERWFVVVPRIGAGNSVSCVVSGAHLEGCENDKDVWTIRCAMYGRYCDATGSVAIVGFQTGSAIDLGVWRKCLKYLCGKGQSG